MAEMGLGYGSEFQLMRFLGHHRNYLNKLICDATHIDGSIHWLDFPINDNRCSGDTEWKGIECFKDLSNYREIEKKWNEFWPQSGNAMNWDGIFKIDDTWFFVEAKAHKEESYQKCSAKSEASRKTIGNSLQETQHRLKATPSIKWIDSSCYQLANRLAFLYFCEQQGIKAKLLYIGFIKGYRRKKDEVQTAEEWMDIWKEEMEILGLNIEDMSDYISFIHPDCENPAVI